MRLILLLVGVALLLAAHYYFISHGFYLTVWWSDVLLHTVGGAWLILGWRTFRGRSSFLGAVFFVLTISLVWEALEYFLDVPFFGEGESRLTDPIWVLDTFEDLGASLLGASLFWFLASRYFDERGAK